MTSLSPTDLQFVLGRTPKDVRALIKDRGLILAGGFIRAVIAGERANDIDLFGSSKDQLEAAARALVDERHRARFHQTDNAFSVFCPPRRPVQFIHRWLFDDAAKCIESFDFTIAQAAIWWGGTAENKDATAWRSCISDAFYPDLAARRLVYTAPKRNEDAGGSILRARKFLMAGYNIQAPSLAGVIARLVAGVHKSGLADSSEAGVAQVLLGLLREVDPLVAIDGGTEPINEHEVVE